MKDLDYSKFEFETATLWNSLAAFRGAVDRSKPPFCVVIPPPNVTGMLHMGHVLDSIPQDVMVRWHRMRGFAAVWIPGTDHAGIATQNVVKKQIEESGHTLESLGREEFIKRVWEFKEKHGQIITNQLKRLGCSCDWERERFTLDEGLARAVNHAFVKFYEKGLIYKGSRMVNWCTSCCTALSDDEVEHEDRKSDLWQIHYKLEKSGSDPSSIIVATTRPETMLGDVAVAVNPDDPRYKSLIGAKVIVPVINKAIPVIADELADPKFGTGAVKITPAHDANDYQVAVRHNLPIESVIDDRGALTERAGAEYAGKDRFVVRSMLVKKLTELGVLEKAEKHNNRVGLCYRCRNVIESRISEQWFIKMRPLAEKAAAAVNAGKIEIFPGSEKNDFFHWMNTIQDWCISRQLWWGHRIPAYYCADCRHVNVSEEAPICCEKCKSSGLEQESDVLDTWFSSQLWPFSTLGWPDKTEELDFWYPTSWLLSGRDILFFWDARMIMAGLELTGKVPFHSLVLHGLVRDAKGRKLSKSLGNSPNPLDLFDKYGTDAVRIAISNIYPLGRNDTRLNEDIFKNAESVTIKLWNAFKFILMKAGSDSLVFNSKNLKPDKIEDRWIISRLAAMLKEHDSYLSQNNIQHASNSVVRFFRNEFCDWYIEIFKMRHAESTANTNVILAVFLNILKCLHLYMPFITEHIWQCLLKEGAKDESDLQSNCLAVSSWPEISALPVDSEVERKLELLFSLTSGVRDVRHTFNISPKIPLKACLTYHNTGLKEDVADFPDIFSYLARVEVIEELDAAQAGRTLFKFPGGVCYLELPKETDLKKVKDIIQKRLNKLQSEAGSLTSKLSNGEFVSNAPAELIREARGKILELDSGIEKLRDFLTEL